MILEWLERSGWEVVSYDFPQSGTGTFIHPDIETKSKNKDSFIPDIVAVNNHTCIFMENKDRFYKNDFLKVENLRTLDIYKNSLNSLLNQYDVDNIFYGIGIPQIQKHVNKAEQELERVDFLICTDQNGTVSVNYDCCSIFS